MPTQPDRAAVAPHLVAGVVDAADGVVAGAELLVRDLNLNRCDELAARLLAAAQAVERVRRALIEAAP